jgi:aldoxime dehydratase
MESAIPSHLKVERTRHRRVPDDYQPPYPSFVARHGPAVEKVVMAYFGVQHKGDAPPACATALSWIADVFATPHGPRHWDRASYMDEAGYSNVVSVAYWDDQSAFYAWFLAAREGWMGDRRDFAGLGTFIEVLSPSVGNYETLFSSLGRPEGVATLADGMSGEIEEHAYWGGMRDRIPLSQTSAMAPAGTPSLLREGNRVRVKPHENICLIRSGQDWSDTESAERKMYLDDVEPVLRAGMEFLRDEGLAIGCFANRYMTVLDRDGRPTEKSYGMSWWKSLAALERWAESHPTHVRIFGAAMKYLSSLGPAAKLRLYHEVTVAPAADQFFEYKDCHERSGMLRAVTVTVTATADVVA